jgi:Tfp pilus assembly PilM family ATPase/Tfp pilus assembly protein PilN
MKTRGKTAFGIDICKDAVSFAELRKNGRQIKIVRCGNIPLDQTIVNNGVIQDPAALAEVLKQLKIAGAFKHRNTTLTICAEPVLLQILSLPDSSPGEVRKFIQNEVRQYAVLPLKNIEMDYCGLRSSNTQTKRALVGAAQTEHLSMLVKAIEKHNINVSAIEPAVAAFIRICYERIIKPQKEKNIMLLLVRDDILNLCVFEKQRLEFLRTKKFEADIAGSEQRSSWLKCEIESVIQFHELEKETKAQGWQIFVACCPENKYSTQIADEIKDQILRQDVEIAAFENSLMDVVIDGNDNKEIPPVAVGAAMRLLDENKSVIKLNLLPKEIVSIKKAGKEMLIIANVAACLLVLLFLQIAFLTRKSVNVSRDIYATKQKRLEVNMLELAESKRNVSEKAKFTENNLATVLKVVEDRSYHNWAELLAELANIVPQTVLIKNLQGKGDNIMEINGLAVSFEAVNNFVGLLGQSKRISSASLVSASQVTKFGSRLIDYSIVCSLTQ